MHMLLVTVALTVQIPPMTRLMLILQPPLLTAAPVLRSVKAENVLCDQPVGPGVQFPHQPIFKLGDLGLVVDLEGAASVTLTAGFQCAFPLSCCTLHLSTRK